jgi:hypothetical protein
LRTNGIPMEGYGIAARKEPLALWPTRTFRALWGGGLWNRLWAVLLAWFLCVCGIFLLAREWSVSAFALSFSLLFGGFAWRYRRNVRPFMARLHLDNFAGFMFLALSVSAAEEAWCYSMGNHTAFPILWKDILFCDIVWVPWFAVWYLYLSKRYSFHEKEALLLAASAGIFYELVGSGAIFNPAALLLAVPLDLVVYAAIFILPMQLLDFSGTKSGPAKYALSPVLPYLLSIPVAVLIIIAV